MSEVYEQEGETGRRNEVLHIHPPLLAASLLVIGLLLHLFGGHQRAFPFDQFFGLLLVAAGTGLSSYAAALFAAGKTTKNPYGEPAAFVITPPYTVTRNPMYVGFTTALLGFAIFFGSPAMLLAPIVFAVVIDRLVIPREEATMERMYGQQYCDYQKRVPRWLPLPSFLRSPSS
jgi:protein-S-isoprenylcysteine O-methyltransferase Ste14